MTFLWLSFDFLLIFQDFLMIFGWISDDFIMQPRPAERNEAGQGASFLAHLDSYQVTRGELFKVTIYTAYKSSNGSNFLTARLLVYWTYKARSLGMDG